MWLQKLSPLFSVWQQLREDDEGCCFKPFGLFCCGVGPGSDDTHAHTLHPLLMMMTSVNSVVNAIPASSPALLCVLTYFI